MKKLLLGIGNEYCGNDALGIIIAQRLKKKLPDWEIKTGAFTGIDFLEAIEGYERVVVIDSIVKPEIPVGSVIEFKPEDFNGLKTFSYLHSMSLATALELGRQLKLKLPEKVRIFGIVIDKKGNIGEEISQVLNEKLNNIVAKVESKVVANKM